MKTKHISRVYKCINNQRGQATVEYVLIGLIIIAMISAFAALQQKLGNGVFLKHALQSLSHSLGPNTAGVIGDVLLY
ncbi:MAG: hypothetical protein FWD45_00470 [Coriobacteriia bacterium]|nr:hypothetical protein [Coriobacteriia bacterium]